MHEGYGLRIWRDRFTGDPHITAPAPYRQPVVGGIWTGRWIGRAGTLRPTLRDGNNEGYVVRIEVTVRDIGPTTAVLSYDTPRNAGWLRSSEMVSSMARFGYRTWGWTAGSWPVRRSRSGWRGWLRARRLSRDRFLRRTLKLFPEIGCDKPGNSTMPGRPNAFCPGAGGTGRLRLHPGGPRRDPHRDPLGIAFGVATIPRL